MTVHVSTSETDTLTSLTALKYMAFVFKESDMTNNAYESHSEKLSFTISLWSSWFEHWIEGNLPVRKF
jgi:hypothetical protein